MCLWGSKTPINIGWPRAAVSKTRECATAPHWYGGTYTLTIKDADSVFKDPCCYQLELRAYKRTFDCWGGYAHDNITEYSPGGWNLLSVPDGMLPCPRLRCKHVLKPCSPSASSPPPVCRPSLRQKPLLSLADR
jgi:hypothetical protein